MGREERKGSRQVGGRDRGAFQLQNSEDAGAKVKSKAQKPLRFKFAHLGKGLSFPVNTHQYFAKHKL